MWSVGWTVQLLFCTTGILLRRMESDPDLANVTHVFVDEACTQTNAHASAHARPLSTPAHARTPAQRRAGDARVEPLRGAHAIRWALHACGQPLGQQQHNRTGERSKGRATLLTEGARHSPMKTDERNSSRR